MPDLTKTQKGGLYKVDGEFVDANGKPAKQTEKPVDAAGETVPGEKKPGGSGAGAGGFDVETAGRADLIAEAERRGLTVTRSDGGDGAPLVEDYRTAIRAAQGA